MLVIDTRMTPPTAAAILSEKANGNELFYLPALAYRATGVSVDLSGCDAVFAAGEKTAVSLLEKGISVADAGSGNGIEEDFEKFLKKRKCKNFAWISASETAANLETLASCFGISIRHFPVYETFPASVDEKFLKSLEHPVAWNFYSGKGVLALIRFVQSNDKVNLFGSSAKKEFENAKLCRESGF